MPISTIQEARDEILGFFTTAWNAQASPPPLFYTDKHEDLPDNGPYARITVQHTNFAQATLGGKPALGGGGRRFRRTGLITVQIFSVSGSGLTNSDPLVDLTVDTFEGEDTGSDRIEFRNVRANEIGQDGPWFQTNVLVDFEYDRVK